MAKELDITGWHSMRKDELVQSLSNHARAEQRRKKRRTEKAVATKTAKKKADAPASSKPTARKSSRSRSKQEVVPSPKAAYHSSKSAGTNGKIAAAKNSKKVNGSTVPNPANGTPAQLQSVQRHISQLKETIERRRQMNRLNSESAGKDRLILLVRDPYWLHAYWELTTQSIERVRAAMGPYWHTAQPVIRLLRINSDDKTNVERIHIRDIPIHGGVTNWYIDVPDPPDCFQVEVGYLGTNGKFFSLARSNTVETPPAGKPVSGLDGNWAEVAEDFDRIYAMSGGYDNVSHDLKNVFEERLKRPVGDSISAKISSRSPYRSRRDFQFDVNAEMIVFGSVEPNIRLSIKGQPIQVRPDGSFSVKFDLPDRRQVLPIVAQTADGVEQRTIVLAVERNTKYMEPVIHEQDDINH